MNVIKRVWQYFKPYKLLLVITLILSGLAAAADGGLAYIIKPIMDKIFIAKNKDLLYILPAGVVFLYTLKGAIRFFMGYILNYMSLRVVQQIRNDLYRTMIYLPIRYYSQNSVGMMMSRVTNDVGGMHASIPTLVTVIKDIATIIGLLVVIFIMNYKMALIAMVVYPLFIHPLTLITKRIRKYTRKGQEETANLTSVLQESFSGVRIVKAFVQEEKEVGRFEKSNKELVNVSLKMAVAGQITSPMMEAISSLGIAAIIVLGGLQVINDEITTGAFFSFLAALTMVYEPAKRLAGSNNTIQASIVAAQRVYEMMDQHNEILENDGTLDCDAHNKAVELRGVSFRYGMEEPFVLKNINLSVPSGTKVALVGHSGAGKSTIANLIPRFYDVTAGVILIDGIDIREYKVHSLRQNIGYVTQEPFLFDDTIAGNVAYNSLREYSMDEIIDACKAAFAHDFIEQLPDKYETMTGERGVRLSGGQKQRITIARALLKNPPLLILDEATSALDTESEREVQKALNNLMQGRTSFVIAHRLSTIIDSDMIVVMEDGNIVDTGNHDELMERCPVYQKLYLTQKKQEEMEEDI